ncbi:MULTISPECIES: O-linked N-acetylglucosamine transferase, SPINDLY family protein [Thiorhodovibrio]|uniref:O-linked N-acetylglucosamine transferase, SPINDLY family protein n=1 Tax=Thiorhodovibrio TaxID=61593 RepID=UPI001913447E|nr:MULTISPECIES: hypothetical protein [Thiorhodovibrio]MBK5967528.1 hypothetical protein [Thiorhodovibrio winogradskyi]WPL14969.1 putative O-linked N-acetylglucosamine transferase, SPINDLY family [Thiorhodovibrio litoralis]
MLWTTDLAAAQHCAARADFSGCLARCQTLARAHANDPEALLSIGALLLSAGLLSAAETCFERVCTLAPKDARPWVNRANRAREAGEHARARQIMQALLEQFPNHPVIRRTALTSLEYDPEATATERFAQARAWGQWAQTRAGGPHPRPPLVPRDSRPLRVGYVSADICQHTVGLFIKDVLAAHDPARITPIVYHAGQVRDWVTQQISQSVQLREVSALDDAALVAQIRADHIDVLIDLSGHTAGSRLSVFAHRPAPVQVSWLGYFATTGLTEIDAVLLDAWHAPPGTEDQFIEPTLRLPTGRFCYQPVPWAPKDLSPPPVAHSARITFGSFNNTAKLNDGVYDLWAQILAVVPDSRLLLKWRTFNDAALRQRVTQAFVARGIAAERIELRGPSFHADLLKEYAELDIALDPFPFTGGLTSCEALWMGVPVITWPQARVVSRQTHAVLHQIGLQECSAKHPDAFVRLATELAADTPRLRALRCGLRAQMQASALMDVAGFVRSLEETLIQLYRQIEGDVAEG